MNNNKSDQFVDRHIGNQIEDQAKMLKSIGVKSIDELVQQTIPDNIFLKEELDLPEALSEFDYLKLIKTKANKNRTVI